MHRIDLEQTGPIELDGEWEFYWNQLLSSDDFLGKTNIKPELTGYMKVPGMWTKELNGKKIPSRGYATYRLKIKLNDMKTVLGLETTNIRFDSRIYVNGTVLMENGRFTAGSKNPLPSNNPQAGYFIVDGNEVEIIVQDINVDYVYGGIIQKIYIGNQEDISRKKFILGTVDFFVFSSLMIISFIHLIIYITAIIRKRNEKLFLVFSLNCFFYAIGNSGAGEKILFLILPWMPTEIIYKIYTDSMYMALIFDAVFLILIGKEVIPPLFTKLSIAVLCAFVILTTFTPLSIYTHLLEAYYIVTIIFLMSIPVLIFQALRKESFGIIGKNNIIILQIAFIFPPIYVVTHFEHP